MSSSSLSLLTQRHTLTLRSFLLYALPYPHFGIIFCVLVWCPRDYALLALPQICLKVYILVPDPSNVPKDTYVHSTDTVPMIALVSKQSCCQIQKLLRAVGVQLQRVHIVRRDPFVTLCLANLLPLFIAFFTSHVFTFHFCASSLSSSLCHCNSWHVPLNYKLAKLDKLQASRTSLLLTSPSLSTPSEFSASALLPTRNWDHLQSFATYISSWGLHFLTSFRQDCLDHLSRLIWEKVTCDLARTFKHVLTQISSILLQLSLQVNCIHSHVLHRLEAESLEMTEHSCQIVTSASHRWNEMYYNFNQAVCTFTNVSNALKMNCQLSADWSVLNLKHLLCCTWLSLLILSLNLLLLSSCPLAPFSFPGWCRCVDCIKRHLRKHTTEFRPHCSQERDASVKLATLASHWHWELRGPGPKGWLAICSAERLKRRSTLTCTLPPSLSIKPASWHLAVPFL